MREFVKGFVSEFREFIAQGNVMDMAVGIIIGGAFTTIVSSLVDNIINPIIVLVSGGAGAGKVGGLQFVVNDTTVIDVGAFLSSVIHFLIVALIVFVMVRALNRMHNLIHHQEEEVEAAAPTCPYCLEEIKQGAKRCPHCGGEIN